MVSRNNQWHMAVQDNYVAALRVTISKDWKSTPVPPSHICFNYNDLINDAKTDTSSHSFYGVSFEDTRDSGTPSSTSNVYASNTISVGPNHWSGKESIRYAFRTGKGWNYDKGVIYYGGDDNVFKKQPNKGWRLND